MISLETFRESSDRQLLTVDLEGLLKVQIATEAADRIAKWLGAETRRIMPFVLQYSKLTFLVKNEDRTRFAMVGIKAHFYNEVCYDSTVVEVLEIRCSDEEFFAFKQPLPVSGVKAAWLFNTISSMFDLSRFEKE